MKRLFMIMAAMAIGSGAFAAPLPAGKAQTAVFAGGSFWSMQAAFEDVYGVTVAVAGYTGGTTKNPNASNYAANGFVQAVQVTWDPARVSYADLLDAYWRHIDPTDAGGQFTDRGPQFRPIVFYVDDVQKTAAEASKAALPKAVKLPGPVAAEIAKAVTFYPADAKQQDYARFNPGYKAWFDKSGRAQFFTKVWGASYMVDPGAPPAAKGGAWTKPSLAILKKSLTPMQFDITQNDGTDPPFQNEYDDFWQAGIYVDVVSGEPLFSSTDKFDSQSGWPSFTRPMVPGNIVFMTDNTLGMSRTEVRSKYADSHLGHVFDDGPPPTNLRYCMDSSALRFIPVADMQKEGYGQYLKLFNNKMMG